MDILQFYAYSSDKNAGNGVGDKVKDKTIYTELNQIPEWRRMFSSKWTGNSFKYKDLTYFSFDHAYQSEKYRINGYHDLAYTFCMESNSSLSKSEEAHKHNRIIKLNKVEIENWDNSRKKVKDELYRAKFTHTSWPGRALMLTKDAILINAGPRIQKFECTRLMEVRKELLNLK